MVLTKCEAHEYREQALLMMAVLKTDSKILHVAQAEAERNCRERSLQMSYMKRVIPGSKPKQQCLLR